MKRLIFALAIVLVHVPQLYADYDFIIEDGWESRFLYDSETLLMTGAMAASGRWTYWVILTWSFTGERFTN